MGDLRSLVVPDWREDAASWETGHHVFCETAGKTQAHLPRTEWVTLCYRGSLDSGPSIISVAKLTPLSSCLKVPQEYLKGRLDFM